MTSLRSLSFLGAGSMGDAILSGALNADLVPPASVIATNGTQQHADRLADEHPGIVSLAADTAIANRRAAKAQVVVVAVKPYRVAAVLDQVRDVLDPGTIVISVAAGVTLATLAEHTPAGVHLFRAMPNTPAAIGQAVTGLSAADGVPDEALAIARALFTVCGTVLVLPENRIDALSAVSGSGPAYFYYFVEQLTVAAERLGFSHDDAVAQAVGTFVGAANLLATSGRSAADLRIAVTSPGGTTEQALAVLGEGGYADNLEAALRAAVKKAGELG